MKKRGKKLLSYLLALVLVLGIVPWISLPADAATSNAAKEVAVNEPSLNVKSANEASLPDHVKRAKDGTLTYSEDGLGTGSFAEEAIEGGTVYRLYNKNSGEHFYTLSVFERDSVVKAGWTDEGVAYDASVKASDSDAVPVYRVFNPNAPANNSSHHYTCNAAEAQNLVSLGWRFEGVGFYVFPADRKNGMTVYREYNKNDGGHNYTTDKAEHDFLMEAGWADENTAWKVKDVQEVGTQKELEAVLATTSLTDLKIATNKKVELSIPEEDYALVDLIVDAPKATITNAGEFRSIDLRSIAADTWTECGKNNRIVVNNTKPVHIIVDTLHRLASLNFNGIINGVNTLDVNSGTVDELMVTAQDSIDVSVSGDSKVESVSVDAATNVNLSGKGRSAINAINVNTPSVGGTISLSGECTVGKITVPQNASGTADAKTRVSLSTEGKAAVEAIEVGAAGAEVDILASGESTIGGVIVSESASGTANEKTNVIVSTENKAAVGFFEMLAAGIKAVITASGKSTVGKVTVPGSASSPDTTVEVKAEDSAEISSVTTSANDANVSVTSNGQSKVGTVKVEGAALATVDGNSSNKTTVDITGAVKGAKLVVKTGAVEIKTTPDTDTSSIVDNQSGSSIPTKSTDSNNNEQSGSIPAKDSGSEGGSGGSSGGYTPSPYTSVKVSEVLIDNPNPKVGDTIRATAYPATASNVSSYTTYQWYIGELATGPWKAIQDADKSTYTVAETDGNMFLKCEMGGEGVKTVSGVTTKAVVQSYEINFTADPTGGGTVAVTVAGKAIENGGKAAQGDNVTVVPSPSTGYEVKTVEIRDTVTGEDVNRTTEPVLKGTYPFTMPASKVTVKTSFTPIAYTLAFSGGEGSTGSVDNMTFTVETASLTVPAAGSLAKSNYAFKGWATTENATEATYQANASIDKNALKALVPSEGTTVTFYAVWAPLYTITTEGNAFTVMVDGEGGEAAIAGAKVTLTSSEQLTEEQEVTVSYTLSGEAKVDVVEEAEGAYTFTMPAANVTVAVRIKTYAITNNANTVVTSVKVGEESVTEAAKDESVTLTLSEALDAGQTLAVTYTDGESQTQTVEVTGSDTSYTFSMPCAAVKITVMDITAESGTGTIKDGDDAETRPIYNGLVAKMLLTPATNQANAWESAMVGVGGTLDSEAKEDGAIGWLALGGMDPAKYYYFVLKSSNVPDGELVTIKAADGSDRGINRFHGKTAAGFEWNNTTNGSLAATDGKVSSIEIYVSDKDIDINIEEKCKPNAAKNWEGNPAAGESLATILRGFGAEKATYTNLSAQS